MDQPESPEEWRQPNQQAASWLRVDETELEETPESHFQNDTDRLCHRQSQGIMPNSQETFVHARHVREGFHAMSIAMLTCGWS